MTDLLQTEPDIAVSVARCLKVWRSYGYRPRQWEPFGVSGFRFSIDRYDNGGAPNGSIIVSQAEFDGDEWIHASLAWTEMTPTYDQLKVLHESVFTARRTAYQVFAASDQHVNIHEHALHLWGRADGHAVLPNFGQMGTI